MIPQIHGEAHVVPAGDLIEHETEMTSEHLLDRRCPCGPDIEPVKRGDGSLGWVVRHHSLDGRETPPAMTTVGTHGAGVEGPGEVVEASSPPPPRPAAPSTDGEADR